MRLLAIVVALLLSGCTASTSPPSDADDPSGPADPSDTDDPTSSSRRSEPAEKKVDLTPGTGTVNLTLDQPSTSPLGWHLGTGENCFVVAPRSGDWVVNVTATLTWVGDPSEMTLLVYNTYTDKTMDTTTGQSPLTVDLRDLSEVDGEHISVVAQLPDVSIEDAENLTMELSFDYDWTGRVPYEGIAYCAVYLPYGYGIGGIQVPP